MKIAQVSGENFRQFERFELATAPRLNLITGANAAGKTTLLEALHCLGRGRSFRGANAGDLCRTGTKYWRVTAAGTGPEGLGEQLSVAWGEHGYRLHINHRDDASLLELVQALPLQVLDPGAHRLLEEGPGYRRRFLDWGVFHVEPSFFPAWRRYQRALRQRNGALKRRAPDAETTAWDPELGVTADEIQRAREQTLPLLRERLGPLIRQLLGEGEWTLDLHSGWNRQQTLAEALRTHLKRDQRMGQTLEGPHRAELRLKLGGHATKHRVSRGQQKLLIAALVLAQSGLIQSVTGHAPLLLVDDFPAELGAPFQARLLDALRASNSQVFLTAIDAGNAPLDPAHDALFHVEQGGVERVKLL